MPTSSLYIKNIAIFEYISIHQGDRSYIMYYTNKIILSQKKLFADFFFSKRTNKLLLSTVVRGNMFCS